MALLADEKNQVLCYILEESASSFVRTGFRGVLTLELGTAHQDKKSE